MELAEQIAKAFHDAYESLAPEHGYETRKESAKPWSDVPENNRNLMVATVQSLLDSGAISGAEIVEEEPVVEDMATSAAIVASIGEEFKPPREFFDDPGFTEGQRWASVTADGRVSGHVALWGECHVGYPGRCITPEAISQGGFDYANGIGHVVTAAGEEVGTSPLAVKGGHAPLEWDWKRAKAHYDDPSTVVADVVYGSDEHGIWFSGALRPSATPEMVYALRASGVSGDWREIDGQTRLLASCCVNNGGFPKMKARVNKKEDRVLAMVAAGGEAEPDPTLKCCGPIEIVEEADILAYNGPPVVVSSGDLEERLAKAQDTINAVYEAYNNEILASLSERLTDA